MPKIIIHSGLTLPGKQEYSHFRADVTFEIDADGDVEEQLETCARAFESTSTAVETALCQQASDTSGLNFEGMGIADEFREFKAKLKPRWIELAAEVEKHGNVLEAAKAAGLLNVDLGEKEEEPEEEEEERPRRRARREEPEEEEEKPRRRGRPPKKQPGGEAKSREAPTRRRSRASRK